MMNLLDINALCNMIEIGLLTVVVVIGGRELRRRDRLLTTFIELLNEVAELRENLAVRMEDMRDD